MIVYRGYTIYSRDGMLVWYKGFQRVEDYTLATVKKKIDYIKDK
jgi:hypothetical protein